MNAFHHPLSCEPTVDAPQERDIDSQLDCAPDSESAHDLEQDHAHHHAHDRARERTLDGWRCPSCECGSCGGGRMRIWIRFIR